MLERRRFLSALALAPFAALLPAARGRAEDDLRRAPVVPRRNAEVSASPRVQLEPPGPLSAALELSGGFRVVAAYGPHFGALPFVIEGEGHRFQLDVLRRDDAGPGGAFDTTHLSVFVHDHGDSIAARERGARALGAALQRRVDAGLPMPALASFAERRAQHPRAAYHVDFRA